MGGQSVKLTKFGFKDLHFQSAPSIKMTNVWADTLKLDLCKEIILTNCFIGTLRLIGPAGSTFEMHGGAVLNIECSEPSGRVPFTGSVFFDQSVYFPRAPGRYLKGPQPYRNMRAHMLKLENTPMVSRFHTLEQATERKMEGYGFHRGISALYELLSDYGSSALRPFLWFILLFAVTALAVFLTDGATHADAQELSGWQNSLKGDDWSAQAIRAFVLTGQSTLNPLGIFGVKGLLVAKTGLLALWLSFHGLLSAIFIALFIFAVRRRFKMS